MILVEKLIDRARTDYVRLLFNETFRVRRCTDCRW